MKMQETQDVVNMYMQALSERNLEKIMPLFADDIDWYIPGNETLAPWLGKRSNKQEVKEFFTLLWSNTKPLSASVTDFLFDNNTAVITGNFSTEMQKTGRIVNSLFFIQMTVENSRITKYRLLEDTYAVFTALTE
ncbi:MAG: hypothetical protein EOO45_09765 [Flavobacterium sp.]|nr:MAG: hypothetical protein EOO45_09765 [Flavobacterium sp.]